MHTRLKIAGVLMLISMSLSHVPVARAAQLVTDPALLGATDQINWNQLGPTGTVINVTAPFNVTTNNGVSITMDTNRPYWPYTGSFKRLDQGNGFSGDFLPGTPLLATNSLGPTRLIFDTPVSGGGAYIAHMTDTTFTAYILAMNGTQKVAEFTVPVTNHHLGDGSAAFIGVLSSSANITDLYFDAYNGGNTIISGPLIVGVPEPTSVFLLGAGALILLRRQRR